MDADKLTCFCDDNKKKKVGTQNKSPEKQRV